jgi:Mg2+ and Co2+ transporter CorA
MPDPRGAIGMDVRLLTRVGVEQHTAGDVPELLKRGEGLVWVDIPDCNDGESIRLLSEVFEFHPMAVRDCIERNRVPKMHAYRDCLFVVLHTPELGAGGHVHFVELDQFIGANYVVTVHGPINPAVKVEIALRETRAVRRRLESGRLRPTSAFDLSYAIVSALVRHQESFIEFMTGEAWQLEQQVTSGHLGNPEHFLDELFRTRHGLLAARTIAALSAEIYGRMASLSRAVPADDKLLVADLVEQFERVRGLADGEKEYLQGVIEFYRTRTDTKMTIAAERLAVIAAITLPITAISSVYGINIIVNTRTQVPHLIALLAVMALMSGALLRWAKRQGWL